MEKVGEINLLRGKRERKRSDGKSRREAGAASSDIADFVRLRKDEASRACRERAAKAVERASSADNTRQRIAIHREEADRQREIDAFWRRFLRKVPPQRKPHHAGAAPSKRRTGMISRRRRPLPAYAKPLIDRLGRRSIYLAMRYLSATTAGRGVARRHVRYAFKGEHVEFDESFEKLWASNVGEDEHEIASGFDMMETANRAARRNAKVVYHLIAQLPHDLSPQQRLEIVRRYCELRFGSHDLPFLAVLHEPSVEGDQRNFHAHILFSFRPMVRRGPNEWDVGQVLRRDLDNPGSMQSMRTDFAAVMTEVAQAAGKNVEYTGLSHAARGLKCRPTEHLGAHKTRAVRDGKYVAANARNARRIAVNEVIVEIERLDRRGEKLRSVHAAVPRTVASPMRASRPAFHGAKVTRTFRRRDPARYQRNRTAAAGLDIAAHDMSGKLKVPRRTVAVPSKRAFVAVVAADTTRAVITIKTRPFLETNTAPLPSSLPRSDRLLPVDTAPAIPPIQRVSVPVRQPTLVANRTMNRVKRSTIVPGPAAPTIAPPLPAALHPRPAVTLAATNVTAATIIKSSLFRSGLPVDQSAVVHSRSTAIPPVSAPDTTTNHVGVPRLATSRWAKPLVLNARSPLQRSVIAARPRLFSPALELVQVNATQEVNRSKTVVVRALPASPTVVATFNDLGSYLALIQNARQRVDVARAAQRRKTQLVEGQAKERAKLAESQTNRRSNLEETYLGAAPGGPVLRPNNSVAAHPSTGVTPGVSAQGQHVSAVPTVDAEAPVTRANPAIAEDKTESAVHADAALQPRKERSAPGMTNRVLTGETQTNNDRVQPTSSLPVPSQGIGVKPKLKTMPNHDALSNRLIVERADKLKRATRLFPETAAQSDSENFLLYLRKASIGRDPLIDLYIAAVEEARPAAHIRQLAKAVAADPVAKQCLSELRIELQRRVRRDARPQGFEQQHGVGRE